MYVLACMTAFKNGQSNHLFSTAFIASCASYATLGSSYFIACRPECTMQWSTSFYKHLHTNKHTDPGLCPLRGNEACNGRLVMSLCHTLLAHQESDLPQYCNRHGNSHSYEITTFTPEEVLK